MRLQAARSSSARAPGPGDLELSERCHVDHAHLLPERPRLLGDRVQLRRPGEPERPLVGAGAPPGPAGPQVVGALPAALRAEHRALLLQPAMQRRQPLRPPPFVDVERIAQPVVVAVDLPRRRRGERRIAVGGAESPGLVAGHVELGGAAGHPLGDRLADSAGAAEAVQREPRCQPVTGHRGPRPEQRVAVGRHRVGMADEGDHPGILEEGEAADGPLQELSEALLVGRQRGGAVLPGHAVLPARHGVRLVAAEEDAAGLRLPVHQVVGIPEAGHIVGQLVPRHRRQRHVLVVDRDRGGERAHHRRHLRSPHAAGVDHALGLDAAALGVHRRHPSVLAELDPGDPRAGVDTDAQVAGGVRERVGRGVRVDAAVVGDPDGPVERLGGGGRHQRRRLVRPQHLDVEADPAGAGGASSKLQQAVRAGGDAQAPHRLEDAQLPVELDAVAAEAHHRRGRVELRDETGGVARRPAGQLALLDQHHVAHTGAGQVVGNAAAGDAATDNNHLRPGELLLHAAILADRR